MSSLSAYMRRVGEDVCQRFAEERAVNPRDFKECAVRYLRSAIGPGPGRPLKEMVTQAANMRAQGKSWPEVYAKCLAHSPEGWSTDTRTLDRLRLRSAVRSRRRAHRKKRISDHVSTENNGT